MIYSNIIDIIKDLTMIGLRERCYLYRNYQIYGKLYHRVYPDETISDITHKWNTKDKVEAGQLSKAQWKLRARNWEDYKNGSWTLETNDGKKENLCL